MSNCSETLLIRPGSFCAASSSGEYDAVSSREGREMTALTSMLGLLEFGGVFGVGLPSVEDMFQALLMLHTVPIRIVRQSRVTAPNDDAEIGRCPMSQTVFEARSDCPTDKSV